MMQPESPASASGGGSQPTSPSSPSRNPASANFTPAMLTLGRDGSDFQEDISSRHDIDQGAPVDSRPWWDRVTNPFKQTERSSEDDSNGREATSSAVYSTLEDTHQQGNRNASGSNVEAGNEYSSLGEGRGEDGSKGAMKRKAVGIRQSLLVSANGNDASSAAPVPSSQTAEELLQQDCAFFYQGMESPNGGSGRRMQRLRALTRPRSQLNQQPFEYRDAVDVLAPPVLAHYRARYQQLNQDGGFDEEEHLHHDLELTTDDGIMLTRNNTMTSTVENSSLFYSLHGRVLMALPRDQVRLVMDDDLEAGILSVEQWRKDEKSEVPKVAVGDRPPLRYVLTVQDDLYRRIVSEMSESSTKRYCGLSGCCNGELCLWSA